MNNKKTVIGMLHIPINTVLAAPPQWQESLGIPSPRKIRIEGVPQGDRKILEELSRSPGNGGDVCPCGDSSADIEKVKKLSFYPFLEERMLSEANVYSRNGICVFMLENTGAPYFVRDHQEPAVFWVMQALAEKLRNTYSGGDYRIGIQILAFSDDWAMNIACRCGLNFVRSESVLFEGIRPEGRTPNMGNLARLYLQRQKLCADRKDSAGIPQVYADIQKKHTVFMNGFESLTTWLSNIVFMKLEGVIVTGTGTGIPVREDDLKSARSAIDKAKSLPYFPSDLELPLLAGSGVSVGNVSLYKKYADAVIAGSCLKKHDYWECELDPDRVARFMDAWYK